MNQEGEREVHPIVREALELAYKGVEPVAFEDWAIKELKYSLKECFGKPDLLRAVVDLINLAGVLQDQGSPMAAMKLIEVVATAADALKEQNTKLGKPESKDKPK